MKRIHILQHAPFETPGCILNWINDRSYHYTTTELYSDDTLPEIADIDWLIVMGGPMSVHDTVEFPWLIKEKKFIKEAVAGRKPVLGICLGSQLIAEVLGSRVYRNRVKEIGWFPVTVKTESLFLKKFSTNETVFNWHGDTFDIPEGALHLQYSEGCNNQSFTYSDRILALQYHLEVTESLLDSMLSNGLDEIVPGEYIQEAELIKQGKHHIERNNELLYSILNELDKVQ